MTDLCPDPTRVLAMRVPLYARRVLHVNCGSGLLGTMVKGRERDVEVYGLETDGSSASTARGVLDGVLTAPIGDGELPFPTGYFDCIVISDPERFDAELGRVISAVGPLLAKNGYMSMPAGHLPLWYACFA